MDEIEKYVEKYGEYLEDIRKRLYSTVIFFAVIFVLGFFLTTPLVKLMTEFFAVKDASIVATSPFQLVDLAMDVGFFFATVFTSPLLLYHIYCFLRPGLLRHEKKVFFVLLPITALLFATGFVYGFATMYWALHMIAAVNVGVGVVNLWDISMFMSQMILTSTLLGLLFEFPIVISFLIRLGLMNIQFMRTYRRHAIVLIFVFVSLLPPTDGLSLILMSAPLIAIYELTILFNSNSKKDSAEIYLAN